MSYNQPKKLIYKPTLYYSELFENNVKERTETPKYPFGLHEIDDLIWGFHKDELLIIGARPSNGKTSFALQGAWNLAKQGTKTVFISLEMSGANIIERIFCNEMYFHGWNLRKADPQEMARFEVEKDKFDFRLFDAGLVIIDDAGYTINQVEEIIQDIKPEFVFVDHAQQIHTQGNSSRYDAISNYVRGLQEMAIKYHCGVVLNSQIKRGGDYLKGSGDLEETADTILNLNWKVKNENDALVDPMDFEVSVEKQRHGACDYRTINFDASHYKFTSRTESTADLLLRVKSSR